MEREGGAEGVPGGGGLLVPLTVSVMSAVHLARVEN
jgi:hypothetical protein